MRTGLVYMGALILTMGLVACSHHRTTTTAATDLGNTPCSGDPYLTKFGCSLEKIQKAATHGNPDAQYALGYMYYYGVNTVQDADSAQLWIARAAAQGQPLAKKALAMLNGTAVTTIKAVQPKMVQPNAVKYKRSKPATIAARTKNKLAHMEARLMHQPKGGYTIQLMGSHNLGVVKSFIKRHHLSAKATYYQTTFHNSNWYMLLYGQYKTAQEAHLAVAKLPSSLRRGSPWIKPNRDVQAEIKTKHLVS